MPIFLYGVLLQGADRWPFLAGLGEGRAAQTRGELYAIEDAAGWYPALTPGQGVVHGMLHDTGNVDLAEVDAFEGAEYHRTQIIVDEAGTRYEAQAYLWRAQLPECAEPIVHGDFNRWLTETCCCPFSA